MPAVISETRIAARRCRGRHRRGIGGDAVDQQFAEFERELTQLREALAQESHSEAPMTIQEELERIGEETASILVVAHDKAHETTRLAQEQAERCISDAAANAVTITDEAKRKAETELNPDDYEIEEALDILKGTSVDLVITDQAMPKMSGVQLIAAIREQWPGLPVILATGYAELPAGASKDLWKLSKPFSEQDLAGTIARLFA